MSSLNMNKTVLKNILMVAVVAILAVGLFSKFAPAGIKSAVPGY